MSRRTKVLKWGGAGLVVIIAIMTVFLLTLDWNAAKPWINRRVTDATGRPFAINGDLSVKWLRSSQEETGWRSWLPRPHVVAQQITFANPDWLKTAPDMADIKQIAFSLEVLPLIRKKIILPSLQIDDANILLQRERDGKNNWTLKNDNSPSAWEFQLQQLVVNKGVVHLVDAIKKADIKVSIDSLSEKDDDLYRIGWDIKGALNGDPVRGGGKAGGMLSLQQQNVQFPLQADLRAGKTSISVKGKLTNPRDLAGLDLQLKVSGVSMAHLYRLTGITLPETPPFATEGHLIGTLNRRGGDWTYENFKGKVGSSDLSGTLQYLSRESHPLIKGAVVSNLLQFTDLAPLIGADSNASKANRDAESTQPSNKVLPVEPFKTDRWTSIDADVQFTGRKIIHKKELPIDNLVTRVQMQSGVLSLAPLNFGVAGGQLTSNIKLDGRSGPIKAKMQIGAQHLKIKQLFPTFEAMQASLGEINGNASLSATGNSIASLLGSSDGEINMFINQGTISKLLLEQMGLNIGNIVLTEVFGDRQVKLNCLASDFRIDNGVMHTRLFVMDTDDATIHVNGDIDMAKEQLDLTLKPESKGVRIISLRAPLYVTGPFKKPKVDVDKGILALKAGSAVALGIFAPVATALLPLVNMGPGQQSQCNKLLAQVNKKPVAPSSGKAAAK